MQNKEFNHPQMPTGELERLERIEEIQAQTNPMPDNPPWSSLMAIGMWIASVLFILIFPLIFLIPYIGGQLFTNPNTRAVLESLQDDPTAILLQIISIVPAHIFTLLLAWLIVTRNKKFSFKQTLGWRADSLKWWNYLIILGGIFLLGGITQYFFPAKETDLDKILQSSRTVVYVVAFLATFTAPLVEEVIYRGILYSAAQRSFGETKAILISTFLFALVHIPQYLPSFSTIFVICVLSLVLTLVRAKTKNLLPCIIFHTIFNGIQSLLLIISTFFSTDNPSEHATSLIKFFWS